METKYYCKKKKYTKNNLSYMYIVLDNNDFFMVKNPEIYDLKINTYDKLVWHSNGVCPVASNGYVKLKITNKPSYQTTTRTFCDEEKFKQNRKQYIEEKCLNGKILKVLLFNSLNWHTVIFVNAKAKMENDFLILEFLPVDQMGSDKGDTHFVELFPITKTDIRKINIDFENCEGFDIYNDEIIDMNLKISPKLCWGSGDFVRKIVGGYMTIKLDKKNSNRHNFLYNYNRNVRFSDFEKRLCGKGFDYHDICHLYIAYHHLGFGYELEECVEIDDLNYPDDDDETEQTATYKAPDEKYDDYENYGFVAGYCEKQEDGTILIVFGEDSKQKLMDSPKFKKYLITNN